MGKFDEYKKAVDESTKRMIADGKKFFYRKNPNQRNEYDTRWQVGIGNEKKNLIDNQMAKVWDESVAKLIVLKLNEAYTLNER